MTSSLLAPRYSWNTVFCSCIFGMLAPFCTPLECKPREGRDFLFVGSLPDAQHLGKGLENCGLPLAVCSLPEASVEWSPNESLRFIGAYAPVITLGA